MGTQSCEGWLRRGAGWHMLGRRARHAAPRNACPPARPPQACDVELLTVGGFTPLDGFMNEDAYRSVVDRMRWVACPCCCRTLCPLPCEASCCLDCGRSAPLLNGCSLPHWWEGRR